MNRYYIRFGRKSDIEAISHPSIIIEAYSAQDAEYQALIEAKYCIRAGIPCKYTESGTEAIINDLIVIEIKPWNQITNE
jgi:hypothetical protein